MKPPAILDHLEFAIVLAEEIRAAGFKSAPAFRVAELANNLSRWARMYNRLNKQACNEGHTDALEAKQTRIIDKVNDAIGLYGITAIFNGDPRGCAIQLTLPRTKRVNGFCADGYGVPEGGSVWSYRVT
jgi:hypothetical protein